LTARNGLRESLSFPLVVVRRNAVANDEGENAREMGRDAPLAFLHSITTPSA
jgi:hypothetical protein